MSLVVLNVKCFLNDSLNAFTLISGFGYIVNLKVFWLVYLLDSFSVIDREAVLQKGGRLRGLGRGMGKQDYLTCGTWSFF